MLNQSYRQPGTLIADQYEVVGRPLMGGMGIVYLCLDHLNKRPVALKTFRPEFLPNWSVRDRFLREGTIWVSLGRHPHIVHAYGVERIGDGREVYLVLEAVTKEEGRADASLRSWLVPGQPLSVERTLLFGLQIVRGMAYATANISGFVHRDLKPENVLIGSDQLVESNINRLRVTDFGLVHVLEEVSIQTSEVSETSNQSASLGRTQLTRGILGTPLYMAPEQWEGKKVTVQTDMYALGCILYEMLTGKRAVGGDNLVALEQAHCLGQLRPLPAEVPGAVREVVLRSLAREPEERYDNWGELEEALEMIYVEVIGRTAPEVESIQAIERGERVAIGWSFSEIGSSYRDIGKSELALDYFERARSVGQVEGEQLLEAAALSNLGNANAHLGKAGRAVSFYEQALAIARKFGNQRGESIVLGNLGNIYFELGEKRRAIKFYEQALAIAREISSPDVEGKQLGNLGAAYFELGDIQRAIECSEQALIIACRIGDRDGERRNLSNLAVAYERLGDLRRAIALYEEELVITREIGDRHTERKVLDNLGTAYITLREAWNAIGFHQQALVLIRELGDRQEEATTLSNLGNAYFQLGDGRKAIGFHEQVLVIAQEFGDQRGEGAALTNLGVAYESLGDLRRAIEYYKQALTIMREIGDRRAEGNILGNLGNAYKNMGEAWQAIEYHRRALIISREFGDILGVGMDKANLAMSMAQAGQVYEALQLAEQAMRDFQQAGYSQHVQQAKRMLAQIQAMIH